MSRIGEAMLGAVYADGAGYKTEGTSRRAAAHVTATLGKRQQEVLTIFRRTGIGGLTADEVAGCLGWHVTTVRPRITELKQKGILEQTGEERPTPLGMMAYVYRMTEVYRLAELSQGSRNE